jgi:CHAT domain-containing protein
LLPPAHYWVAFSDYQQNRLSESNKQFQIALRLAEAGNNTFEAHHSAEALALNYSELGELEPALSYASKMLSLKALYYEETSQSLRDLGTLADLTLKLKLFPTSLAVSKESLSLAQASSAERSQAGEVNNRDVNDALRHLVNAALAQEDFAAALNYANDSKQAALSRGNNAENTRMLAEINMVLGDVKTRMDDCSQAVVNYDQALELYRYLPEFTFNLYPIHKGKLFCFQQLDQQENFDRELKTVLKLSEEYRATIREDDSRQAFFANEQDVFDAAAVNAIRRSDDRLAFAFVEESRARSLLDFVESDQPIAAVEKSFGAVVHPLKLPEIQARLPEQVQLVQYAVLRDRLAIWTITKTRFDFVAKQISAAELEQKVADYQRAIVAKTSASELQRAGKELYELLIPSGLAGDKQLCFVPDKSLHQLAFASLISPGGKFLLEDFALSYAPSGSVFVLASENAARKEQVTRERVLSVGNPEFERDENLNLPDLPTAADEAKTIATEYYNPVQLFGAEATKEKFLHDFAAVDVIHFAGHFVANPRSPGNSKLLFAGGDLRSSQLGAYKLPKAKLVVLSACETGFERYDKSEGAIGIARTFLALGAPLVVASEWKVDSEPTKDLMIAFHHNRRDQKLTTAESLRQAQLATLRRDETRAPFYWAAFSLFGGYASY